MQAAEAVAAAAGAAAAAAARRALDDMGLGVDALVVMVSGPIAKNAGLTGWWLSNADPSARFQLATPYKLVD